MTRALRSIAGTIDRLSSRVLGRDGSVRNIRSQLEDRQRSYEQIAVLERRLAALVSTPTDATRAA